jgi:hypothetical protein
VSQDLSRRYRALEGTMSGRPDRTPELHLIREDSETSLCGIPRAQLSSAGGHELLVCADCLDWLPKRVAFSGVYPKVEMPKVDLPKIDEPKLKR